MTRMEILKKNNMLAYQRARIANRKLTKRVKYELANVSFIVGTHT